MQKQPIKPNGSETACFHSPTPLPPLSVFPLFQVALDSLSKEYRILPAQVQFHIQAIYKSTDLAHTNLFSSQSNTKSEQS